MAKFNEKKEKYVPTVVNKMGTEAYKLTSKEELVSTVLTTFIQKSYYESEKGVLDRIRKAAENCDPLFVAKLAVYTRNEANMRSSSHVLAAELAKRAAGQEWARRFYDKIVVRPDDMSEIISYYNNVMKQTKLPNALKVGFKNKLERLDAYLIDKYKMGGREISLIDLVNLFHPHPTQKNAEAYRLLMKEGGKGLDKLYSSKILEKEMSKAGKTDGNVDLAKKDAITSVLDNTKGMPIFNLLRNLRNILLYAPDKVNDAIEQLTTKEKIEGSRLLPFRFLSAYNEINAMGYTGKVEVKTKAGKIQFEDEIADAPKVSESSFAEGKRKILVAIERAIELSCANIPTLEGRTAILIDHSGSMRGDGGGHSLVSALSKTRSSDIANVFASMFITHQPNVYVGLFGDRLLSFKVDRKEKIIETARRMHVEGGSCGGGTEAGIYDFFNEIKKTGKGVDNIIIFSDMVIGDGCSWYGRASGTGSGSFPMLFKDFRKNFPAAKVVSVDIKQTDGSTVFNKNYGVTQVAGWSDKIFDVIGAGTVGYKALIEEIEKIVI